MNLGSVLLVVNGTSKTVWYDVRTGRTKAAGWINDDMGINGVVDRLGFQRVAMYVTTQPTRLVLQAGRTRLFAGPDLAVELEEGRRGSTLIVTSGAAKIKAFEREQRLCRDEQSWDFLAFIANALTDETEQHRLVALWSQA